jgi:hypothetical protein
VLFAYFGVREGENVLKETWLINVTTCRDTGSVRLTTSEDPCSKTSRQAGGRLEQVVRKHLDQTGQDDYCFLGWNMKHSEYSTLNMEYQKEKNVSGE